MYPCAHPFRADFGGIRRAEIADADVKSFVVSRGDNPQTTHLKAAVHLCGNLIGYEIPEEQLARTGIEDEEDRPRGKKAEKNQCSQSEVEMFLHVISRYRVFQGALYLILCKIHPAQPLSP